MPRCPTCFRRLALGRVCPVDGARAPAPAGAELPGEDFEVPGYPLRDILGVGGFAVVWRGTRTGDGMPAAVKVAREHNPLVERRLLREADALRALGPPITPGCLDVGQTSDGRAFIAMDMLAGRTLADALETMAEPAESVWIWRVSEALLSLLQSVHGAAMIHRDLKPENVFLIGEDPPELRLFDFGLTLPTRPRGAERLTRPGTILGTAEYMAPEQIHRDRPLVDGSSGLASAGSGAAPSRAEPLDPVLDRAVDIYAFGVVLYELFTLRPPFVGDRATVEHGHLALRPPSPRQFAPVPEALERVMLTCLAKNPARRPGDVHELRQLLSVAWEQAAESAVATVSGSKLSLLVDKRQPVILAVIDGSFSTGDLDGLLEQYGGFVARQRGQRHVCAFSGLMVDDPFESALLAAQEAIAQLGARVAIQLAPLAIRRKRRRPMVIGRAVDRPAEWLPTSDWNGLLITAALADTRPPGTTREVPECPGFYAPVDDAGLQHRQAALHGRADVMVAARDSLEACLASATPGLFTVLGAAGLGKSRLARELALQAAEICPEAEVVQMRAAKLDTGESSEGTAGVLAVFDELGFGEQSGLVGGPVAGAPAGAPAGQPAGDGTRADARAPAIVIIDDAQWCDAAVLDRVEYATLDHDGVALWVAVIAHPNLESTRAQWGARAHRHARVSLTRLEPESAMALAAELLLPAEYPPAAFLHKIAEWAGYSPQLLTGLVAELKRRGVVRRRAMGAGWHVATAELERLPAVPAEQWLGGRILDGMPPELASCVRVCAVLGASFTVDELAAVQHTMDERGGAGTPVDADVGLAELCAQGLFERSGKRGYAFTRPAFQDSVYKLLATRDRQQIHEYAAAHWAPRLGDEERDDAVSALSRFARHAAACGREHDAAVAYVRLGDRARRAHLHVEADNHYTSALRMPDLPPVLRAQARAGRGRVRYHIYRINESYEDLQAARAILEELGDTAGVLDLWLEEASAADMAQEYLLSAQCTERAWQLLDEVDDAALAIRALMSMGRTHWRHGRLPAAVDTLGGAADQARDIGDVETEIVALLLLGPALVWSDQAARAEGVFARVIERCTEVHDQLHECAAYANRMFLWRKQPDRAIDDLRRAIDLARRVGNPDPERTATHNLAELLYWSGEEDEALSLARRARILQQRFWQQVPHDALLLARIHAVREEFDAARNMLDWLDAECAPDGSDVCVALQYEMIRLVVEEAAAQRQEDADDARRDIADQWQALTLIGLADLPREESIEIAWWCARQALRRGQFDQARKMLEEARERIDEAPVWKYRVDKLATQVREVGPYHL